MTTLGCSQLREMAPDVALGLLTGAERAAALGHLEGCADCRAEVAALAGVADEVLLTAPDATPPEGFDHRVLMALAQDRPGTTAPPHLPGRPAHLGHGASGPARLLHGRSRPAHLRPGASRAGGSHGWSRPGNRRGRPNRVAVGATLAAAAALVLVAVLVTRGDRSPDETAQMVTGVGEIVGTATVHDDDEPATLSIDLPDYDEAARPGGTYRLVIELENGSGSMTPLESDDSYWRVPLEDADGLAKVSVVDQDGYVMCSAEFPA
jgi:hypothetical protein